MEKSIRICRQALNQIKAFSLKKVKDMKIYKTIIIALCAFFIVACNSANSSSSRTPTDTLKALSEAGKKKDVAGIKKLLSKNSLELLEKSSKSQNQTSDQLLTRENGAPFQNITDYGKEATQGETSTVEIKTALTNEFENIPLIIEDGEWKVALDKYVEELKKRLTEQMKTTPTNANVSNQTNIKPNTNQNSAANEELKSIQNRLKNK